LRIKINAGQVVRELGKYMEVEAVNLSLLLGGKMQAVFKRH
jgi:hypothetical protein